jgi:hypothetical protein
MLVPGLDADQARQAAQLATLMLQAALYPRELPDPLPVPLYAVALMAAGRLARAGDPAGSVVSESLGAYSYRLNLPTPLDQALMFTDDELGLLRPWLGHASAYDVRTPTATAFPWPIDWWQRDLDEELDAIGVDPGVAEAAAKLALSKEVAVE